MRAGRKEKGIGGTGLAKVGSRLRWACKVVGRRESQSGGRGTAARQSEGARIRRESRAVGEGRPKEKKEEKERKGRFGQLGHAPGKDTDPSGFSFKMEEWRLETDS